MKVKHQITRRKLLPFFIQIQFYLPIMVSAKSSSVSDILWKMEDDDGIMIGIDRLMSLVLEQMGGG